MSTMKVCVMEDIKNMSVREMEIPKVKDNEVLIKIYTCNICTTDWQTWAGLRKSQGQKFPWACGHEMGGEIVEIGKHVNRNDLEIGTKVSVSHPIGCNECYFCRKGHPSRCISDYSGGLEIDGVKGSFGMSQYLISDSKTVYAFSDDLPYAEIGYFEPVSTAVHGIRRARIQPGENVLIIGAGNLGLVNAQVARVFGANVIVSEIEEERCKISRELGFYTINPTKVDIKEEINRLTNNIGVDAVVMAVGKTEANNQGLSVLASRGRLLFFAAGYPAPEFNIDSNVIHYKEFELIGAYGGDPIDFQLGAKLLNTGQVKVDKLLSKSFKMDDVQKAFEAAATPGNYRVTLEMW